jgi:uncharacterized membrane protein
MNSASSFASLCVLLVLVSGLPLHNQVIVFILAILMVVAITSMLLTYTWVLALISPNHIFNRVHNLGYIMVIKNSHFYIGCFLLTFRVIMFTTKAHCWLAG